VEALYHLEFNRDICYHFVISEEEDQNMATEKSTLVVDTMQLAARHGLDLTNDISFNEMGLDFRVAFAKDVLGRSWVLRIPRRQGLFPKIVHEAKILNFVKIRLNVKVPDWQVCTAELVAYPMLLDPVALTFDAQTYAVTWYIDQHAEAYLESLAELLVALHASPIPEARSAGIKYFTPEMVRSRFLTDLENVKREIGINKDLDVQLRKWLDDDKLWPDFSVLIHGDLYAGHVTADANSRITGVIDWSEAEIADPSIDFTGHLVAFGSESLEKLVAAYAGAGGRTWPTMTEQIKARHVASPVRYGLFAITTQNQDHLAAAKAQLGVSAC
jgi:macrolide phosphotransferase